MVYSGGMVNCSIEGELRFLLQLDIESSDCRALGGWNASWVVISTTLVSRA